MSIPWVKDGHLFLRNDEQRDRNWGGGLSTWQKKSYVWIDSGKNWNYVVIGHFCLFFCLGKSFIWMGHNQFSWTCPNSEMIHKRSQGPPAPAQCHVSARKSRANWGTMMINQPLNKGQLCLPSLKLTSSLPSWKMYGWKMMRFPFWENPPFSGQKSEMALSFFGRVFFPPIFCLQKTVSSRFEAAEKCLGRAAVEEDALGSEGSTSAASSALLRLAQLMLQVLALRFRKPSVTWVAGEWWAAGLKEKPKKST